MVGFGDFVNLPGTLYNFYKFVIGIGREENVDPRFILLAVIIFCLSLCWIVMMRFGYVAKRGVGSPGVMNQGGTDRGRRPRTFEARELDYITSIEKKAVRSGYENVRDRMEKDPQYANLMSMKAPNSPGYTYGESVATAAFGPGYMQGTYVNYH